MGEYLELYHTETFSDSDCEMESQIVPNSSPNPIVDNGFIVPNLPYNSQVKKDYLITRKDIDTLDDVGIFDIQFYNNAPFELAILDCNTKNVLHGRVDHFMRSRGSVYNTHGWQARDENNFIIDGDNTNNRLYKKVVLNWLSSFKTLVFRGKVKMNVIKGFFRFMKYDYRHINFKTFYLTIPNLEEVDVECNFHRNEDEDTKCALKIVKAMYRK